MKEMLSKTNGNSQKVNGILRSILDSIGYTGIADMGTYESNGNDSKATEPETNVTLTSKRSSQEYDEEEYHDRKKGISWPMCALYILGNMAGGGIVALPYAIKNTFFYGGIVMCLLVCAASAFTCVWIGKCWAILQQRYAEYRLHTRQVYGEIGYRAMGRWMKIVVMVVLDINQVGACMVFLLLSAKGISEAIKIFANYDFPMCHLVPILFVILWVPVVFLKSPEDFGWLIFMAMACSVLSVIFIISGSIIDFDFCYPREKSDYKPSGIAMMSAVGSMIFAFGGHTSFPTIQHDMRRPHEFSKSAVLAYGMALIVYMPMSIFTNITYGDYISPSIINMLQTLWIQQTVNIMIILHCMTAFILLINPLTQQMEDIFKAPHELSWRRVLIRSVVLIFITFFALSFPVFDPILDLTGATAILLTGLVFPVLFYLYLNASGRIYREKKMGATSDKLTSHSEMSDEVDKYPVPSFRQVLKYNDRKWLLIGFSVMTFGLIICVASTVSASYNLTFAKFEKPCYVQWVEKAVEARKNQTQSQSDAKSLQSRSDDVDINAEVVPYTCCYGSKRKQEELGKDKWITHYGDTCKHPNLTSEFKFFPTRN